MKQIIATPHAPAAIGTYSQAVKVGNTVYLSGQIPLDPATMQLVEGFENQVKGVFDNLKAVCEAAGGSLNDLVKVNVFLIDLGNFAKVNEIMATYVSTPYPANQLQPQPPPCTLDPPKEPSRFSMTCWRCAASRASP